MNSIFIEIAGFDNEIPAEKYRMVEPRIVIRTARRNNLISDPRTIR